MRSLYLFLLIAISFSADAQSINNISPRKANVGDSVEMIIYGSNTHFIQASQIEVWLATPTTHLIADTIIVINDNNVKIRFFVPKHAEISDLSSKYTLFVRTKEWSAELFDCFSVNGPLPKITSITPLFGYQGEQLNMLIKGSNCYFTAFSSFTIYFGNSWDGGFSVSDVTALNDSTLKVNVSVPADADVKKYQIAVRFEDRTPSFDRQPFEFSVLENKSRIVSILPTIGTIGKTETLLITGHKTNFTTTSNLIVSYQLGSDVLKDFNAVILNDTMLKSTITIPFGAPIGLYDVLVTTDVVNFKLAGCFDIGTSNVRILSITPPSAMSGDKLNITVKGTNTNFKKSDSLLIRIFSQSSNLQIYPIRYFVTNDSTISVDFEIPETAEDGLYDFKVVSSIDGELIRYNAFTIGAVGLNERPAFSSKMYPNPVKKKLIIETRSFVEKVTITDITGKEILVTPNDIEQKNTLFILSIDHLTLHKGVYFIRLESDGMFDYQKFIVE